MFVYISTERILQVVYYTPNFSWDRVDCYGISCWSDILILFKWLVLFLCAYCFTAGDHRPSYSSLGMSNQQRALERKRYSEGNLVSVGSMKFDLALPVPLTHSDSVMVGDPMARVHAVDAGPLVSRGSLIQKTNHIATCLPNDSSMVPHVPIHHTTTCNPCTTTRTSPVALRSLLRRNRSVSMRSTVTFLDTPSIKGRNSRHYYC